MRFVSYLVATTPWQIGRRVHQSRAIESWDKEPWTQGESCQDPVCLARLSRTWRKGRAVDRFSRVSRVLESPSITGEVLEQQLTECQQLTNQEGRAVDRLRHARGVVLERCNGSARGRDHDTSSSAASKIRSRAEEINSVITIAAENSLRSTGTSRMSSNRVMLGWHVCLR